MQQGSAMKATGGRAASRERRAQLVQGKGGMPPAAERSRMGTQESAIIVTVTPVACAMSTTLRVTATL